MLGLFVVIFILLVVPYLAVMGVFGVVAATVGGGSATILLVGVVIAAILQLLLSPLYQAALVIAYYDLRVRKEGFDLEVLASSLQAA
jgi:hypothetical protein